MKQNIESAYLISLNVGMPSMIAHGSKEVLTGIFKQPSQLAHKLSMTGLQGDGQGDTVHHGGPDKAVCAYFEKRYPLWEEELGASFQSGSFGENFTLSNWTEDDLCIGDQIQLGEILLEVSQPRQPCFKLGLRNGLPDLPVRAQRNGFTGFYFRVLQEGEVREGAELTITHRHPARKTIAEANRIMYIDKEDVKGLQELLEVEELAKSWRDQLGSRLSRLQQEN